MNYAVLLTKLKIEQAKLGKNKPKKYQVYFDFAGEFPTSFCYEPKSGFVDFRYPYTDSIKAHVIAPSLHDFVKKLDAEKENCCDKPVVVHNLGDKYYSLITDFTVCHNNHILIINTKFGGKYAVR